MLYLFLLKVKAREEQIARVRHELDEAQHKIREANEVMAEKDGQLRLANMNLQTAHKQAKHHTQEVCSSLGIWFCVLCMYVCVGVYVCVLFVFVCVIESSQDVDIFLPRVKHTFQKPLQSALRSLFELNHK